MSGKYVALHPQAKRDVAEISGYYEEHAGDAVALHWIDAVEAAFLHVGTHPGSGSRRYMGLLGWPDLRFWRVRRFPYLVFYVEARKQVDVWRVLHAERDIPPALLEGD